MSDTPLTQSLYDEHRYFANEEEATEAILGFRDLCQKLERENAKLREALHQCMAATGEEAGDLDDFRALVDRESVTVEAVQSLRREANALREALKRARTWTLNGRNYDAGVSMELQAWIDEGMSRPLPPLPSYLAGHKLA